MQLEVLLKAADSCTAVCATTTTVLMNVLLDTPQTTEILLCTTTVVANYVPIFPINCCCV